MQNNLVIGALLHDIGKLIYRSLQDHSAQQNYCHQELGAAWARGQGLSEEITTIIQRHHSLQPDDPKYTELSVDTFRGDQGLHNTLYTVAAADGIASGMERPRDYATGGSDPDIPLCSIFDRVHISGEKKQNGLHYWQMLPLQELPYPREKVAATGYPKLWQGFNEGFTAVGRQPDEETLLTLLQNYTFTIPEHTCVTPEPPDTSLYHHLKTTAAIACCNYLYLVEEKSLRWNGRNYLQEIINTAEQKYLLVAADLSGIQDFVYTLSSKGALKTLRARSFYLNFLQESIATRLLEQFGLPRSCIIYSGGGGFFLLAPNTETVRKGLAAQRDELNRSLFKQFATAIFLALDSMPLTGEDLSGASGYLKEAWGKTRQKLDLQKSRKWADLLEEYDTLFCPTAPPAFQCSSCRAPIPRPPVDLEEAQCRFCRQMTRWSSELARLKVFYQVEPAEIDEHYLECGGYFYSYGPGPSDRKNRRYIMKDHWTIPGNAGCPTVNFFQGTHYSETLFQDLVTRSTGVERLGVLRMDVDFLGRIFSRGLAAPTFARLNDLSERLNMYFNCYLPALLQKERADDRFIPDEKKSLAVNLVYSGGDDLLLVGTWDSALETACRIHDDFTAFTGDNESWTLSGGLAIADEKMAFYKLADLAGKAEDKAKSDGRDRLCLFEMTLPWKRIKNSHNDRRVSVHYLLSLFLRGVSWTQQGARPVAFSRAFVQKLIFLAQKFRLDNDLWIFSNLYYLFARTMNKKNEGFYKPILAAIMQEQTFREELIPALQIVDYLTRGGEKHE